MCTWCKLNHMQYLVFNLLIDFLLQRQQVSPQELERGAISPGCFIYEYRHCHFRWKPPTSRAGRKKRVRWGRRDEWRYKENGQRGTLVIIMSRYNLSIRSVFTSVGCKQNTLVCALIYASIFWTWIKYEFQYTYGIKSKYQLKIFNETF